MSWNEAQKERQRRYNTTYLRKIKLEVFTHYSEGLLKCKCCGESNYVFLTLDHMDSSGKDHRREVGFSTVAVYRDVQKKGYPEGFQILCYNCNCSRAQNKGICPHKEI